MPNHEPLGDDPDSSQYLRTLLVGGLLAVAAAGVVLAPPPANLPPPVPSRIVRIEGRRMDGASDEDDAESDAAQAEPQDIVYNVYDTERLDPYSETLDAWKGLIDPATYPEYRQLLRALEGQLAQDAGISTDQVSTTSRRVLNGIVLTSMTPDEVRQVIAGDARPALWDLLVDVARDDAQAAMVAAGRGSHVEDLDVLKEIAESQRALAETLNKSQEESTSGNHGWAEVVKLLTPAALAGAFLKTCIDAASKGVVELIKQLVRSSGRQADGEKAVAAEPMVLALRVTRDAAFQGTTDVLTAASPEDLPTVVSSNEKLLVLAFHRDIDPQQMAQFRLAARQGVASALSEHVQGVPPSVSVAIVGCFDDLVDRVV